MKSICELLLLLGFSAAVSAQSSSTAVVLNDVTVIDVGSGRAQPNLTVAIERDRIVGLGAKDAVSVPAGATVLNASGKYVIPGLWDMHVHTIFGDWFPKGKEIALPLFIANGVTGVRDMGGELEVLLQWRKDIALGSLVGPRMVISGPMLDGPEPRFPSSIPVTTPEDGRSIVSDLKRRGADFIKLQSLMTAEAVAAILDEARKNAIPIAGHVPDAVRAVDASNAGQKSFEHLIGIFEASSSREEEFLKSGGKEKSAGKFLESFDPSKSAALIAALAKNQTWQCPTMVWERGGGLLDERDLGSDPLARYAPASWKEETWKRFTDEILKGNVDDLETRRKFVDKAQEVVSAMHRAGVPFLAGTDTAAGVYIFPGFSLHDELELFVKAGFTPREALATATTLPAKFLEMEDRLGSVEPGKIADLVLLDANPLEEIGNTRKIFAVVANGRFFSRGDLDELLRGVETEARLN
jgi:imidazolonepropionase-like amidohydrolase